MTTAKHISVITILLFIITGALPLSGQNYYNEKFKLAQSFEQNGDYINASRIYLELYSENNNDERYFEAYVRVERKQDKHSELIPFVERHLTNKPAADNFILLGELYWRDGLIEKADAAWENAVKSDKNSQLTYTNLASTQMMLRLFGKATNTYLLARENLGVRTLFADQLSQLYAIGGNYKEGTNEVLNLFAQTHNIALVQGRLSALAVNKEAEEFIYDILLEKSSDDDINYKRIFAWFVSNMGRSSEALEIYKNIDTKINARGAEVYQFAINAANDSKYDIAISAFRWIIEKGKESQYTVTSLFRLAKTMEQKYEATGSLDETTSEDIIQKYRNIIREFPNTSTSHECRFNIALLYIRHKKYELAIPELEYLTENANHSNLGAKSNLLLGEIFFMNDDMNSAILAYTKNVTLYKKHKDEYFTARFALAEIEYFNGNLDTAVSMFTDIAKNTGSDAANDALAKISMINDNKNMNRALSFFAEGEKFGKQRRYSVALAKYLAAAEISAPESIFDLSLINAADMNLILGNNSEAIANLKMILETNNKTIHADYCYFKIAEILYLDKSYEQSTEYLTKLLKDYPRSIYNEEAREIIRKIRASVN